MNKPDWIAVGLSTTKVRAWAMTTDGKASDKRTSTDTAAGIETLLLALIDDWLGTQTPVICCGINGASQGWPEAPDKTVPCPPLGTELIKIPSMDTRLNIHVIPGIKQEKPTDMMQGQETQIAGFLAHYPDFDGVLCLPGTHSKWARISAREVVSFTTFLTGELFELLSRQSVLRHVVSATGWDNNNFLDALDDAIANPKMVAARLFSLRAEALLNSLPADTARARLSGVLLGLEIGATRPYWLGQNVALIAGSTMGQIYGQALAAQGIKPLLMDAHDGATLAGLVAAHAHMKHPS